MSKLTSLAIGLLSAIAIVPATSAMAATSQTATIVKPAGDLHAQIILKIGTQDRHRGYYSNWEYDRYRRRVQWQREREYRSRSGYYHPRDRYYGDRHYRRDYRDYRDYRYYR